MMRCGGSVCEPDDEEIDAVYRKLKDYEDLEEQGLLVKLPCKVGDTVYVPTRNFVSELRQNVQKAVYPDQPQRLLCVPAQDRCGTV